MLVERARTISELSELIRCVHSGRGGVAVITGPAAVGKTELTHSLAEIAEEDDLEVLRARMCVPGGQGRRGLFEQLAESLRRQPGRSAGTFAGEKPENPDGAYALAGGTAAENPLRAAEEIARYAHRQPLLVVIDDLHHADPDSLDGILHLVRALPHRPDHDGPRGIRLFLRANAAVPRGVAARSALPAGASAPAVPPRRRRGRGGEPGLRGGRAVRRRLLPLQRGQSAGAEGPHPGMVLHPVHRRGRPRDG
ncbi:ATP-binding protein [Streptomyces sp. SHP22-7]|nr:ATP-binding protein [Streptomyces sp. SHP22-7]